MTAHVVYPALDDVPATLSRVVCTDMLRHRIGFRGVLISDDLEMHAVAARAPIEELAVEAVSAGCDLLLICSNEDAQTRAHAALVRHAEAHASFRVRCEEAAERVLSLRRQYPSLPQQNALDTCKLLGSEECRDAWEQMVARGLSS